jgi:GT2 family glycosyltransferase
LSSLKRQSFKKFEIILVYSKCSSALKDIIRNFDIISFKENGSTLGAARNLGVRKAHGDIVAFIDDDAEATADWIENIFSAFNSDCSLACLGGPQLRPSEEFNINPSKVIEGSFTKRDNKMQFFNDRFAVGKIAGCNVAYRKKIFEAMGCLDESLRSGEDWEFHIRLVDNGCHILFDPNVQVLHHKQDLKHAFVNSSNMPKFYLSRKTLKYARFESLFTLFYLSNVLLWIFVISLFFSPILGLVIVSLSLMAHFVLIAARSKFDRKLASYPIVVLFILARLTGFYYGILRQLSHRVASFFRR